MEYIHLLLGRASHKVARGYTETNAVGDFYLVSFLHLPRQATDSYTEACVIRDTSIIGIYGYTIIEYHAPKRLNFSTMQRPGVYD